MQNNWQILKLENVSQVVDSLHATPEFTDSGYPMVRAADIKGGFLDLFEAKLVSRDVFLTFTRNHKPKQGDIVLSRVGSYFNFSFVKYDQEFCMGQNTSIIVPSINNRYLYYSLLSPFVQSQVEHSLVGTSQKTLSLKHIRELKIPVPSNNEQRAIAEVLGALDDKIELNRRMNATLEQLARALFQSWFVDFDPVRAKAEGRAPAGMDAETAALFPSRMDGDVPEGWKEIPFSDFLTHSLDRIGKEVAPEYSATVIGLSLRDQTFKKTLSQSNEKNKRIVKNDLVFGLSRQTLNFGVMQEDIGSVSPVYEIFKVNANVYIPVLLELYIRMNMGEYIGILKPCAREGQAIDRHYLLSKLIVVPDIRIQRLYLDFCAPFFKKIEINQAESRTLAELRDTLLPRLMSGEVRVRADALRSAS